MTETCKYCLSIIVNTSLMDRHYNSQKCKRYRKAYDELERRTKEYEKLRKKDKKELEIYKLAIQKSDGTIKYLDSKYSQIMNILITMAKCQNFYDRLDKKLFELPEFNCNPIDDKIDSGIKQDDLKSEITSILTEPKTEFITSPDEKNEYRVVNISKNPLKEIKKETKKETKKIEIEFLDKNEQPMKKIKTPMKKIKTPIKKIKIHKKDILDEETGDETESNKTEVESDDESDDENNNKDESDNKTNNSENESDDE